MLAIIENLGRVRERIARAAEAVGRRPEEITLVGVTKYVDAQAAAALASAGCTDLGESRPQALWQKAGDVAATIGDQGLAVRWHLVGHLQRNKIRRTLPLVEMIHSVDSERLLTAIQEESAAADRSNQEKSDSGTASQIRPLKVLLEVNTSGEAAKHGLAPGDVEGLLSLAPKFPSVRICGLMTIAALAGGAAVAARNFASLRELRDRLRPGAPAGVQLDELSMGMSGDFEVAIGEGATIIRIGSLLWES